MSVRCLIFNVFYLKSLFCAVRTIWGSSHLDQNDAKQCEKSLPQNILALNESGDPVDQIGVQNVAPQREQPEKHPDDRYAYTHLALHSEA